MPRPRITGRVNVENTTMFFKAYIPRLHFLVALYTQAQALVTRSPSSGLKNDIKSFHSYLHFCSVTSVR